MATVPSITPPGEAPGRARNALSVSTYDRTATMVLALLVIFGTLVLGLMVIFFANKFNKEVETIAFVPVEASSPNANGGIADDPEPPGVEDAPELSEPGLQDTLAAITTSTALSSDALLADTAITGSVEAAGKGKGLGDARQPGPGGDGVVERVPRWERWKIRFEPASAAEFAKWLDQFKIRVGVLGRDNKVHLAWNFSDGTPEVEAADPAKYASWGQTVPADGPMPELTRQLARDAGILQLGRISLLFYPSEVESALYLMEKARNESQDANKIRETVFTVLPEGDGYRFAVIDQKYF